MNTKLYNLPIKTFKPENLMEEILKAKDGDFFVLDEVNTAENIGDYWPEITTIQVKKVREERRREVAQSSLRSIHEVLKGS